MIKTAPPPVPHEFVQDTPGQRSPAMERMALTREFEIYEGELATKAAERPIKVETDNNPFIRRLHDTVGPWDMAERRRDRAGFNRVSVDPPCLVFEWMDHCLKEVQAEPYHEGKNNGLPKVVAHSVLKALEILASADATHTDISPNNIFVSDIDGASPTVKLGDLGNLMPRGFNRYRVQPLGFRAPEVWRGLGCWPSSDVWSLGVTLAHWITQSKIFGPHDKIVEDLTDSWCIAKIERLIGPLGEPAYRAEDHPKHEKYTTDFNSAETLARGTFYHPRKGQEVPYISVGPLREELEARSAPPPGSGNGMGLGRTKRKVDEGLLDFIESLLVVDHRKRPTATQALKHPYLRDLES